MKTRLAALIGSCAVVAVACGPGEEPGATEELGTGRAALHRVVSASLDDISLKEASVHLVLTTSGPNWIISAVHRTPSGQCALGSGPIGSPGYAAGMMADINKCKDMCPGGVDGMRAAEDGQGGCKLQCDCKGDGIGFVDAPAQVVSPTP